MIHSPVIHISSSGGSAPARSAENSGSNPGPDETFSLNLKKSMQTHSW